MDQYEIIALLGFPDEITSTHLILSQLWRCDSCNRHYNFAKPAPIPAPCEDCGYIAFTALDEDQKA